MAWLGGLSRQRPRKKNLQCINAVTAEHNKAQSNTKPFFDEVLDLGTAVIMTLDANLMTQHGVPKVEEAGPSSSCVFRTITETSR